MPLAFLARTDEDADVAKLWADVWEEGSMSQAAALRLYISDLAPLILESGSSHQPPALPDILSRLTHEGYLRTYMFMAWLDRLRQWMPTSLPVGLSQNKLDMLQCKAKLQF